MTQRMNVEVLQKVAALALALALYYGSGKQYS
jgi:hypothetical protein